MDSLIRPVQGHPGVPMLDADALPPLDPHLPPWPGREFELAGGSLHVRDTPGPPGGPTAVYLHGLSGSATNWTDVAGLLGSRAPGVAVDLPGFGRSAPPATGRYRPADQAAATIALLESLDEPAHLLGNSLGGATALLVADARPDLVRTLTLVSPAMPDRRPDPRRVSDPRLVFAMLPLLGRRARRELIAMAPRERVEQVLQLCFADPRRVPEHRIVEATEEAMARAGDTWATQALTRSAAGLFRLWVSRDSLWKVAARVQAPTLVVWGGRDRVVSARLAQRTAAELPHGRLLLLPMCGHVPQLEQPETVARAVLGMWETAEAGDW